MQYDHVTAPVIAEQQKCVDDLSRDDRVRPDVGIVGNTRKPSKYRVVDPGAEILPPAESPDPPPCKDNVEALPALVIERGNIVGIVLKIAVHDDDEITSRVFERRGDRRMLPEIAAQSHGS